MTLEDKLEMPDDIKPVWLRFDFDPSTGEINVTGEVPEALDDWAEVVGKITSLFMNDWVREVKYFKSITEHECNDS